MIGSDVVSVCLFDATGDWNQGWVHGGVQEWSAEVGSMAWNGASSGTPTMLYGGVVGEGPVF